MTDACRLRARLSAVHQDLLETLLAHDAGLTAKERRRGVWALEWLRRVRHTWEAMEEVQEEKVPDQDRP